QDTLPFQKEDIRDRTLTETQIILLQKTVEVLQDTEVLVRENPNTLIKNITLQQKGQLHIRKGVIHQEAAIVFQSRKTAAAPLIKATDHTLPVLLPIVKRVIVQERVIPEAKVQKVTQGVAVQKVTQGAAVQGAHPQGVLHAHLPLHHPDLLQDR
ncbi:MAG: hypothetical protein KAR14_10540, partial [Candidatus Aminicenantes bacterium]|nr:hypothetical protein [Candidatus Aminicenantes bacterium]